MSATSFLTHEHLTVRYCFTGTLTLETGLHIGSGLASTLTDATVMRTADGIPFIPGSSFKGALRSAVERIAPKNIHAIHSCQLIDGAQCLTMNREYQKRLEEVRETAAEAQRTAQSYRQRSDNEAIAWLIKHGICAEQELNTPAFARALPYRFIEHTLCDTCRLFGSTAFAAKIRVSDLHIKGDWVEMTEIRDGVSIDRDTETAKPKFKFNLEVMPAQTDFAFRLDADNLSDRDLGLLCIGLQEFRAGSVPLGGCSTRGLGQCRLVLEAIYHANLGDVKELIRYLTAHEEAKRMMAYDTPEAVDGFIRESIRAILLRREVC